MPSSQLAQDYNSIQSQVVCSLKTPLTEANSQVPDGLLIDGCESRTATNPVQLLYVVFCSGSDRLTRGKD